MSNLNNIVSQINSLTGYNLPTSSNYYIISSSSPVSSGSVNQIIQQVNTLTGFNIPPTNVVYSSGSNISSPVVIYVPTAPTGTISTDGIYPGGIIKAEHLLNIINALNGINPNLIILSGSLVVSGSATLNTNLDLPFVPDQDFIYSSGGFAVGTNIIDGGTF